MQFSANCSEDYLMVLFNNSIRFQISKACYLIALAAERQGELVSLANDATATKLISITLLSGIGSSSAS